MTGIPNCPVNQLITSGFSGSPAAHAHLSDTPGKRPATSPSAAIARNAVGVAKRFFTLYFSSTYSVCCGSYPPVRAKTAMAATDSAK